MVENPPANAGDMGPGHSLVQEDPICCGQLSPCATTSKPVLYNKRGTAEPIHSNEDPAQPNKYKIEKIIYVTRLM